jgi:GAF domain-containing protein
MSQHQMSQPSREERINAAFVKVADTLMDSYDILDLLSTLVHECTDLLDVQAGGLLIASGSGTLELVASTSEEAEFVEIMQLAAGEGPCIECYRTGVAVSIPDIQAVDSRWPEFSRAALQNGFRSVHATPMRLRGRVIGTMNLLGTGVGVLDARDAALAQALADVAIIGILQERSLRDPLIIAEQLHLALDTRMLVEQAKGVLMHTRSMSMDTAFNSLREHARVTQSPLRVVAEGVIARTIDVGVSERP